MILVEFECQGYRFALPLSYVRRVAPSAGPTPLPGAPQCVLGVINLGGEITLVFDFFQRVGLPFAGIKLAQQFLVIAIGELRIALVVDQVSRVVEHEIANQQQVPDKFAGGGMVSTISCLDDGLCLICDPANFLLNDEKTLISQALEQNHHALH